MNGEAAPVEGWRDWRQNSSICAALVPEDRHQRQDEVGLIERFALAVDPHEDLGDLLLVERRGEFHGREWILLDVVQPIDCLGEPVLLVIPYLTVFAEPLEEVLDEPVPGD